MAIAIQLPNKPPSSASPPLLLLFFVCLLLLSCSHQRWWTCSGSGSELSPLGWSNPNLTVSGAFDQLPGYLFLTNMSTCRSNWERVLVGLASSIKNNHPALDLSQKGWFFVRQHIVLSKRRYSGHGEAGSHHEASFSIAFTLSSYLPNNQAEATSLLVFALEPLYRPSETWGMFTPPNWQVVGPSSNSSNPTASTGGDGAGSRISAEIGVTQDNGTILYLGDIIWVQISIEPLVAGSKHSVWIDYDHVSHRMSVYAVTTTADEEGAPKPVKAIASKILEIRAEYALPGLFSSMGQLLQVHTWNSTVDGLPDVQFSEGVSEKNVILYSVPGSAAVAATAAVVAILYVNSKYRRWKKEKDELTKIMQGIPGVPTHVDFTDIKKATKNFHEAMKLGNGGFGAVYRCTLPAVAASSSSTTTTGRASSMDVAVKKFMREVEGSRYSDFLAEPTE